MTVTGNSEKSIIKELIFLSVPAMTEEILNTLLQYVDTAMVGHLGENATAAVSTTTTIGWLIGGFLHSIGIALLALMSRSVGAGDDDRVKRLAHQAVVLTVLIGAMVGGVFLFLARYIPRWMSADVAVRHDAYMYFFIISIPMVFRASALILGSCIRATLDTKSPMVVNILANVINILLDWIFIYKMSMGVIGAAWATAVSYTVAGILMFAVFARKKKFEFSFRKLSFDAGLQKDIAKVGLPAAVTHMTSSLGYVVFAGLVSGMGITTFAAHSIAVNAETIVYIPGYGLSGATSAMIGVAYGANDEDKLYKIIKAAVVITITIMIVNGGLLYWYAKPLMRVFTESERVISLGAKMLRMVAFSEPFFGLMIAMQGVFYGMGKTLNVFVIEVFCMWGIRILCTVICVKVFETSLTGVWYCMIADNICKAILLSLSMVVFMRKQWR